MHRAMLVLLAVLVVLCGYQWRSLRTMRAEIEGLRRSQPADNRGTALQQFTPEHLDEAQRAMTWLDDYYASAAGLNRPQGLCHDGKLDSVGLGIWLFNTYLPIRISGAPEGLARQKVLEAIQGAVHPRG